MDALTLNRISLLHPKVREEVKNAYLYVNNRLLGKGVRLRFSHTLRTNQEQDELYAVGRTKKGSVVTSARGGQSIHNYGLAFDIVLLIDTDGTGSFNTASWDRLKDFDNDGVTEWMEVVNYFKSIGWTWGGDWKNFKDYPHFQKTFGHTWRSLKAKQDAGDVFIESIDGITYKWVNL